MAHLIEDTEKNKNILPNMFDVGIYYAITINPSDLCQHRNDPKDRIRKMHNKYVRIFRRWDNMGIKNTMFPELSTPMDSKYPSRMPRYHFHGKIMFQDYGALLKWYDYLWVEIQKNNIVDIDTIEDIDYWDKYCSKNSKVMSSLSKQIQIRYPTFRSKDFTMVELQ